MKVKTGVKSGGVRFNHRVRVRTAIQSGGVEVIHGARIRTTRSGLVRS